VKKLLIVLALVAAWCLPGFTEETIVKVRTNVLSDYVVRGQTVNDSPVLQSEVEIERGIFDLRLWGNGDLTDRRDNAGEFTEFNLDFKVEKEVYSKPGSKWLTAASLFGGAIYYSYPNIDAEATTELYAGVDMTSTFGIHSRLTAYYDIDEADGAYLASDFYKVVPLPVAFKLGSQDFKLSARPEVGYGWGSHDYNKYYFGVHDAVTTDWHAQLAVLAASDKYEFGPSIRYTDLVGDDIQDTQRDSSCWVYGFSFGFKF
jgi:hypothetical protein